MTLLDLLRLGFARALYFIGWQGMAGLALVACGLAAWLGAARIGPASGDKAAAPQAIVSESPSHGQPAPLGQARPILPVLPASVDVPLVLKRIQMAAQDSGLTWPSASYRYVPLTPDSLASLEIQTTLKGPYVKIKKLIATLLNEQPALAMREFTLTRPHVDTSEVEAKIRWTVFLQDGWQPGGQATPTRRSPP